MEYRPTANGRGGGFLFAAGEVLPDPAFALPGALPPGTPASPDSPGEGANGNTCNSGGTACTVQLQWGWQAPPRLTVGRPVWEQGGVTKSCRPPGHTWLSPRPAGGGLRPRPQSSGVGCGPHQSGRGGWRGAAGPAIGQHPTRQAGRRGEEEAEIAL